MVYIAREKPDLEAICWGFQILSVPLFQSIRPEREWQSTSFSSGSVVLGFPQIFTPAWAEDQFPTITHPWLSLYSDFSELISSPCPPYNTSYVLIQDVVGSGPNTGQILTHAICEIIPWKGRNFCRGLVWAYFWSIFVLVSLIIKWKSTRDNLWEVVNWK